MSDYYIQWFRLFHDWLDDPKIIGMSWEKKGIYIGMLSYLNKFQRPANSTSIDTALIGHWLRLDKDFIEEVLQEFLQRKLINKNAHGYYCNAFKERQKTYDKSTARVKEWREKKKGNETFQERSNNVHATHREEKIREDKKEEEYKSNLDTKKAGTNGQLLHPLFVPFTRKQLEDEYGFDYTFDLDDFIHWHIEKERVLKNYKNAMRNWQRKESGFSGNEKPKRMAKLGSTGEEFDLDNLPEGIVATAYGLQDNRDMLIGRAEKIAKHKIEWEKIRAKSMRDFLKRQKAEKEAKDDEIGWSDTKLPI